MRRFVLRFLLIPVLMLTALCSEAEEHKVERGETALQIAIDHNLTMDQLSRLNPDVDLEMMRVGDILIVPDEDSTSFEAYMDKRYGELLRVTDLNCVTAADRSAVCLFLAENLSDRPLFDIRFRASVLGSNGTAAQAEAGIGLMQIIPGEKLPVYIGVPGDFAAVSDASVSIVNLSDSEKLQSSFRIDPDLYTLTETFSPDGISAVSTVLFTSEGLTAYQDKKINVLSAAYDADGRPVGVRSLYSDCYPRLDITVYSAGAPIRSVEIRMEAY